MDGGGCLLCEWVHMRQISTDVAEGGFAKRMSIREEGSLSAVVLTKNQQCFSFIEANKNKCGSIYYTHKHIEKQTDSRH